MLNDCIRIGLATNKTSLKTIQSVCYPELRRYSVGSAYKNNAMSRACGILSNYRVSEFKHHCRETKRKFKRNDVRIRKQILQKYGKLEADKTASEIRKFTTRIIKRAKKYHLAVAIEEEIKDIRKLGGKGNWQGRNHRFKLNSWARGEAKRQLIYKGTREGVMVLQYQQEERHHSVRYVGTE